METSTNQTEKVVIETPIEQQPQVVDETPFTRAYCKKCAKDIYVREGTENICESCK